MLKVTPWVKKINDYKIYYYRYWLQPLIHTGVAAELSEDGYLLLNLPSDDIVFEEFIEEQLRKEKSLLGDDIPKIIEFQKQYEYRRKLIADEKIKEYFGDVFLESESLLEKITRLEYRINLLESSANACGKNNCFTITPN